MFPDFYQSDIRSKIVTSVAEEAVKTNQNINEIVGRIEKLQNTISSLQNDLRLANDKMEQNRIEAEKATIIADKKNWRNTLWLSLITTALGAILGFVLSLVSGI